MNHETCTPTEPAARQAWIRRLRDDLQHNVLPWWQRQIFDAEGRVLGGRGNDGAVRDLPRSAVLGARLLWTFASAQRRLGPDEAGAEAAQRAWRWLSGPLTDAEHGGVVWSVNAEGRPLADHKQTYAQAFAIYALCACHDWQCGLRGQPLASATPPLQQALHLFDLLDAHALDDLEGGYVEGCNRHWQRLPDARLSALEPAAAKTLNTLLHMLEACTELLRCCPGPRVATRLHGLVLLFLDRLWLPSQRCFGQFFTRDWRLLTPHRSWGHDIEAAWLLVRAATQLQDTGLCRRTQALALEVADAVLDSGTAPDGRVHGAGLFDGTVTDRRSHWWCQAEAMLGFWDAFECGGRARHAQAAWRSWQYIERHHVDPQGGDWFKTLDAQGRPLDEVPKAGPWECPYHHARAELEMIERLGGSSVPCPPERAEEAVP